MLVLSWAKRTWTGLESAQEPYDVSSQWFWELLIMHWLGRPKGEKWEASIWVCGVHLFICLDHIPIMCWSANLAKLVTMLHNDQTKDFTFNERQLEKDLPIFASVWSLSLSLYMYMYLIIYIYIHFSSSFWSTLVGLRDPKLWRNWKMREKSGEVKMERFRDKRNKPQNKSNCCEFVDFVES